MISEKYMKLAVELAKKGEGSTSPNPMVGAVIVKDERIIGQGFHERCGEPHAERNALADCITRGENPAGADLYVTLTPCCHYGKTPPCTEAIIENNIARVIIGSRDPNPKVLDKSISILESAGIKVITDFMKEECDRINPVFFHYITKKTPYVIMKYAMTMDGKIATAEGYSKWITGERARDRVHRDRNRYSAIMAGIGTVLADDPLLTCRIDGKKTKNPVRIICDTNLRTPLSSKLVTTADSVKTILATAVTDMERHRPYLEAGCKILTVKQCPDGLLNLTELMYKLGSMEIDSLILEGGAALNWSTLSAGIVNKVQAYIAPKIFGGMTAKTPVGGLGVTFPKDAYYLKKPEITVLDGDILIEWEVESCSQES